MIGATMGSRNTCTSCFGDGGCAHCDGSGIDPHFRFSEDQPKCPNCSGTGVCQACSGSDAWTVPPPEIIDQSRIERGLSKILD